MTETNENLTFVIQLYEEKTGEKHLREKSNQHNKFKQICTIFSLEIKINRYIHYIIFNFIIIIIIIIKIPLLMMLSTLLFLVDFP